MVRPVHFTQVTQDFASERELEFEVVGWTIERGWSTKALDRQHMAFATRLKWVNLGTRPKKYPLFGVAEITRNPILGLAILHSLQLLYSIRYLN